MNKIFENNLKSIIKECIQDELNKYEQLNQIQPINETRFREYVNLNYKDSLNEMSRINTKEFYGVFPYNKFRVVVWSNDHNSPHFHVICENNDIKVDIMSGNIIGDKIKNNDSKIYSFVEKNVKEWLNTKSALDKTKINREVALLAWIMNNSEENNII